MEVFYINCNYSQPTLIKLDNENIGGHLTHLQRIFTVDSLKDANLRKDVPFWGLDDE